MELKDQIVVLLEPPNKVFLINRVELKVICHVGKPLWLVWFLINRVELKGFTKFISGITGVSF